MLDKNSGIRDWHVIGRAEKDKLLLVECQQTGALGTVKDFSETDWDRAVNASVNAFRWNVKWGEVLELTPSVA